MRRPLLVMGAIAPLWGCAQLAGIDDTTAPPVTAGASLTYDRYSIGATVVQAPQSLGSLAATYLVPDEADPSGLSRVPATLDANSWSADVEGAPPSFYTLPDVPTPFYRLLDVGRNVSSLFTVIEHPNPTPPPDAATIATTINIDAATVAGEAFVFYTLGAWSQRVFTDVEVPVGSTTIAVTFPYTSATSLVNRPLEKITAADAVLVLKYVAGALVAAVDLPGFDQTAADTITGTLAPVTRDQSIAVAVDPAAIQMRFATGRPATTGGFSLNWSMVAAPGSKLGASNGPTLASGGVALADTAISSLYGNPFTARAWPSTFTVSATTSRTFTPPAQGIPVTLSANLAQVTAVGALEASLPAPLPELISINGAPISTDGSTVTLDPAKAVTITFVANAQTATLYQLLLFELVPNADNTALIGQPKLQATSTKASFVVPQELFVAGHTYTIRASCITGGFPGLATGDLQNRTLPLATGSFDSAVFTVMP